MVMKPVCGIIVTIALSVCFVRVSQKYFDIDTRSKLVWSSNNFNGILRLKLLSRMPMLCFPVRRQNKYQARVPCVLPYPAWVGPTGGLNAAPCWSRLCLRVSFWLDDWCFCYSVIDYRCFHFILWIVFWLSLPSLWSCFFVTFVLVLRIVLLFTPNYYCIAGKNHREIIPS